MGITKGFSDSSFHALLQAEIICGVAPETPARVFAPLQPVSSTQQFGNSCGLRDGNRYSRMIYRCAMLRSRKDPKMAKRIGARSRELRDTEGITQETLAWACVLDRVNRRRMNVGAFALPGCVRGRRIA